MNHDQDFYQWSINCAEQLRTSHLAGLDLIRIAEEIEDMGRSEKHALASHFHTRNRFTGCNFSN
ncbi:DUF29 family protein [Chromatium okenii]|jgi:hypothetical protein|uniref:DUF29 domain-containing protein n=1 Tax=Chromatium okenii TaxID=61644 RepID=A0A2S7XP35_9GAMM|nr:DUF29 family protein [Chromatium okenii]PQJ95499.1 hypothetical protein CXB77_15085 [Chromatium okenii]